MEATIKTICRQYGGDKTRLMDIVLAVQERFSGVSPAAIDQIAQEINIPRVEVESVVAFYAFLSDRPSGKVVIRLCNDIIDRMAGSERVGKVFQEELGIEFGDTTADGAITLEHTPCIGMCDQAPAALINDVVIPRLSTDKAREIVAELRRSLQPKNLVKQMGDGNNAHDLVSSMVRNNIRMSGPALLAEDTEENGLRKALRMTPAEVIRNIKTARLRGRGGAGFPTGMKWEFTRAAEGSPKYIICNADEGEPGTFKDRVLLTERADLLFEGMTIGAYAIGASNGIVYLRAEYSYLRSFLEETLERRRRLGLLGQAITGKADFSFDIRIQMGAGAYVCGEETALISSCEGLEGSPKNRPPFPAQKGYLGCPTSVNNVETLCCVARIMDKGPGWFAELGNEKSSGTKLLSISGDCKRPGIYEVPFGITLREVLKLAGAEESKAVQVGGPSGQMVGPDSFDREICFEDLATGGSIMVFGAGRDILEIVHAFIEFFAEESCGTCTPCRVGTVLMKQCLERILAGRGNPEDVAYLKDLGATVKKSSRCGLGQTAANPILTTIQNFPEEYEKRLTASPEGIRTTFDMESAVAEASAIAGRKSVHLQ